MLKSRKKTRPKGIKRGVDVSEEFIKYLQGDGEKSAKRKRIELENSLHSFLTNLENTSYEELKKEYDLLKENRKEIISLFNTKCALRLKQAQGFFARHHYIPSSECVTLVEKDAERKKELSKLQKFYSEVASAQLSKGPVFKALKDIDKVLPGVLNSISEQLSRPEKQSLTGITDTAVFADNQKDFAHVAAIAAAHFQLKSLKLKGLTFSEVHKLFLSWPSVTWTFGPFVINHRERRKVHAKETSQLHRRGEGFYPQASFDRTSTGFRSV